MNSQPFDPYRDRLSRDIRNQLSASIMACMRAHDVAPAQVVADRFLAQHPGPEQVAYMEKRLAGYAAFLRKIENGPEDVLWWGMVLWDLDLFFEVHEVVEDAWHHSKGQEKLLLQAMIRAAGVYIKRPYGFDEAVGKLAAKALPVLENARERLSAYTNPEKLYAAMRDPQGPPPKLLS